MVIRRRRRNALYAGPACPRCAAVLRHESIRPGLQSCPRCGKQFEAVRFDPVEPLKAVAEIAGVGPSEDAPCAKHARNKAESSCARCGQFMCALCRIDADGKAYCPACFERLSSEGALQSTATKIKNYAGMAALCAILNLLLAWMVVGVISGPLGVFYCVRGLGQKKKLQETEGVAGLYVLMVFNILETLGCIAVTLGYFGVYR